MRIKKTPVISGIECLSKFSFDELVNELSSSKRIIEFSLNSFVGKVALSRFCEIAHSACDGSDTNPLVITLFTKDTNKVVICNKHSSYPLHNKFLGKDKIEFHTNMYHKRFSFVKAVMDIYKELYC